MSRLRKQGGYAIVVDPCAPVYERDTFTCAHCNSIKYVKPRERPEDIGGSCGVCWGLICGPCVDKRVCDPMEKKLERMEKQYHTRRNYEEALR